MGNRLKRDRCCNPRPYASVTLRITHKLTQKGETPGPRRLYQRSAAAACKTHKLDAAHGRRETGRLQERPHDRAGRRRLEGPEFPADEDRAPSRDGPYEAEEPRERHDGRGHVPHVRD